MKMQYRDLPKSRPEIWRLAKWLHGKIVKDDIQWAVADKVGWYDFALSVHNEVFRQSSPYLDHEMPMEAMIIETAK